MADDMIQTAILPYYGSKRGMAPEIVQQLGPHRSCWEPFGGSLAVLLAKEPSAAETVNDLHGEVINLARVIASAQAPDLFERLGRTLFCEPLFAEIRQRLATGLCVEALDRAYCFFVESWMGRNGIAGTRQANTSFCKRYTSAGGDPAVRFRSAVASIPAWYRRLQGVQIYQSDAFALLERIEDRVGTVIYADPPYLVKGSAYCHDFRADDHERLALLLRRFQATRVVLSYYADPRLAALYPNWVQLSCAQPKTMSGPGSSRATATAVAPEVLLLNGPAQPLRRDRRTLFTPDTENHG